MGKKQLPLLLPAKWKDIFHHKVVWITGASSGIGEQLSYLLDKAGAHLILTSRSAEKLESVKQRLEIRKESVMILPADLSQLDQLPVLAQKALARFGHIDYLILNAGIAIRDLALKTRLEVDRKIMDLNYFSAIALTKLVLPSMLERKSGHIAVTSSMSSKFGVPRSAAYAASKHALHGFFNSLRTEIDTTKIPITIVIPGIISTEITAHAMTGDGSLYGKLERTNKEGYPPDLAAYDYIRAIVAEKEETFVGGPEGITLFINRLAPRFMNKVIGRHPIRTIRNLKERMHFSNPVLETTT